MNEHTHHTTHDKHAMHDQSRHDTHAGHDAHAGHGGHGGHEGHEIMFRNRFWVSLVLTIPVLIYSPMIQQWLGYRAPQFAGSDLITPLIGIIIFIYGGLPFLEMARGELAGRKPGMMTLISLAITVAFVYSLVAWLANWGETFFWELVTLIDIMLLGHWIEMRSVRQASGALTALAQLMPDEAERIMHHDHTEIVPVAQLQLNDVVLVRPGATIPADGVVIDGTSSVDEAMITGESKPVRKMVDSSVIGGTVNGDGSLRVQVMATGDASALSGIMRLVAEAQTSKSRTQLLADRAAAWLFYAALIAAGITAVAWLIAVGFDIEVIRRVVAVLIIACPHALGLAVPLVVAITTSQAARNGILIRNRLAMEDARHLDMIVFDKTGTLTTGKQGIVGIHSLGDENRALALAAAVEKDSEHMVARAIRQAADSRGLSLPAVSDFQAIKGRGVQATVAGETVYVGGPRLLEWLEITLPDALSQFSQSAGEQGHSVVYLIEHREATAALATADTIRSESYAAVEQLHKAGVEVAILTGDSNDVAQSVARELGIETWFAQVLPADKDDKISQLQKAGKKVAMVGDGVNDAPALTRADVGIAIGGGTDVAVESADIVLVNSNPLDVAKIITLSQASHRKMVQNIWWAAGYNIIAIPLAAGLLAPVGFNMPVAVGAIVMSLSTIIVALNAQLLRRIPLNNTV